MFLLLSVNLIKIALSFEFIGLFIILRLEVYLNMCHKCDLVNFFEISLHYIRSTYASQLTCSLVGNLYYFTDLKGIHYEFS